MADKEKVSFIVRHPDTKRTYELVGDKAEEVFEKLQEQGYERLDGPINPYELDDDDEEQEQNEDFYPNSDPDDEL